MENEIEYPGGIPPVILDGIPAVSRRDYFAAMALQGLLAGGNNLYLDDVVRESVEIADRLIKRLDKQPLPTVNPDDTIPYRTGV